MQIVAVILAGGMGTRIRHLLPGTPKPMAPIHGRPFLEWIVLYFARQGISRVVISSGYRADQIEAHFGARAHSLGSDVICVAENEPLGTAGGFLHARRESGIKADAWLIANGDSLVFVSVSRVAGLLAEPAVDGAMVCVPMADTSRSGSVAVDHSGWITQFREKQPGEGLVNAGIYLLRDRVVRTFPEKHPLSFEAEVFPTLISAGARLKAFATDAPFLDIGTEDSFYRATGFVDEHIREFTADDHLASTPAN